MTGARGIHHVTAIASDPQRNLDFYAGVLGLRFVKRTVNFDDPFTYHFYFGDEIGRPGSIMTFFPWPKGRRGRQGNGQVAITAFAVAPRSLGFWIERCIQHGVAYRGPTRRGDEQVLELQDADGLMLQIVSHPAADSRPGWGGARGIAESNAIRGFHSVTLWEEDGNLTEQTLVQTLGFRPVHEHERTRRYAVGDGGPGMIVDVRTTGGFVEGQPGAGTVHHVAWRVHDDAEELAVRQDVVRAGLEPTPVIDRSYFRSVYFREPGGVLFEIATDTPGFATDEHVAELGQALKLPPQYESRRAEIEAVLPRIHLPTRDIAPPTFETVVTGPEDVSADALGFIHRFVPSSADASGASRATLLLLHGTGGDEDQLVSLGRDLLPGAALLSPRGKVNENGAMRFFRRIREGVFDQEDLARRTQELAAFIEAAAATYALDVSRVVPLGFSNGANIAGSLLLRRPELIHSAVLLSPMIPFEPDPRPTLSGKSVFIGAGRADTMVPADQTERFAELLRECGADVTVHWDPGGHTITKDEINAARTWLRATPVG
jgi:glyoxalase family protein